MPRRLGQFIWQDGKPFTTRITVGEDLYRHSALSKTSYARWQGNRCPLLGRRCSEINSDVS